ncbi:erythromycin esterase family protein [Streptomyces jumonjinensis]|uniref:Erythromycin esterase family protein n=1 Tax=Streptomyces jumonjinensis TaxID=1945 RepID=A0A646KS82_STRJU|nr:erythromycin esterase family protein [Streptomyces jumonjinensis]MQT05182.1 erythromycin esterase family protein [Streptomyces jumonjinensis]
MHFPPSPSPSRGQRNAGSLLRRRFGSAYRPIGFTFGRGQVRAYGGGGVLHVPPPGHTLAEHTLDAAGSPGAAYLVDLRAAAPPAVAAWRDAPARTRMVGPGYDPAHDADHCMTGGSLKQWFDALVHVHQVTPAQTLS